MILARRLGVLLLAILLFQVMAANDLKWVPAAERQRIDLSATLRTLDGRSVSLSDLAGKILFLNFWATWCGPCRQEMPSIESMQERLAGEGVVVALISDDRSEDVEKYLEKTPYPFRFLLDPGSDLTLRLEIPVLPTTIIVDSQSRIALAHVGAFEWDSQSVIDALRQLGREE